MAGAANKCSNHLRRALHGAWAGVVTATPIPVIMWCAVVAQVLLVSCSRVFVCAVVASLR